VALKDGIILALTVGEVEFFWVCVDILARTLDRCGSRNHKDMGNTKVRKAERML
jgi:hypothetical protein